MPIWLKISEGPVLQITLWLLVLGLLRRLVMAMIEIVEGIRRAGDRRLPYFEIAKNTFSWLIPFRRIHSTRQFYSYASFILHIGILFSGFFLANHIEFISKNLGISWPRIYKPLLDIVTILAIIGGLFLLLSRIYNSGSRRLSKTMDYILLLLILNIFLSGFIAGRAWNPFSYNSLMLFHTINGILLLLLIPYTKVAHCILFPLIRLSSEIGWRFPSQGGKQVVESLYGPEGRNI
jgi:nitrate reductase gamma subunit